MMLGESLFCGINLNSLFPLVIWICIQTPWAQPYVPLWKWRLKLNWGLFWILNIFMMFIWTFVLPLYRKGTWQPQIFLNDGPRVQGGMAQSKDLLKQSARGSSAALPLKCHNSGVTDRKRKKKTRNGFWTKIKVQQQGRSRRAKSLKAHRVRWNLGLCTATNHFRGSPELWWLGAPWWCCTVWCCRASQLHPGLVPPGTKGNLDWIPSTASGLASSKKSYPGCSR